MDTLTPSKLHRFDSEIKINKKEILSIRLDENNMIICSKKKSFDEDNIILCSKKKKCPLIDKKDVYCIKILDEIFKKTTIC